MFKFEMQDQYVTWFVTTEELYMEDHIEYQKGLYKETKFTFHSISNRQTPPEPVARQLGYFYFSPMPGCCGIVVSHNTFLNTDCRGSGVSDPFRKIKNELAKALGYTVMIATTQMHNLPGVGNMIKSKYKIPLTFTNKRTSNLIGLGYKVI